MTKARFMLGTTLVVFTLVIWAGCSAHKSAYKKCHKNYVASRYDLALSDCATALRAKPDYPEAQTLIQDVFKAAVNAHEEKIRQLRLSAATYKWDEIVPEYEAMIELNQAVENLPSLTDPATGKSITFQTSDYSKDLADAKNAASETHYQEGLRLSQADDLESQRKAADHFETALWFTPYYKDADDLYGQCRGAGVKLVAIIPFQDRSGKRGHFGALTDMIADEVLADCMNDQYSREFLEIISRSKVERALAEQQLELSDLMDEETLITLGKTLGVHGVVFGQISQILYDPPRTITKTDLQIAEVVIEEQRYKDKDGKQRTRQIMGEVQAAVTTFTRVTSVAITGSYKIIDIETGRLDKTETFSKPIEYDYTWATFSGDARALNPQTRQLVTHEEFMAPSEQDLVNEAARALSMSLAIAIKEYAW